MASILNTNDYEAMTQLYTQQMLSATATPSWDYGNIYGVQAIDPLYFRSTATHYPPPEPAHHFYRINKKVGFNLGDKCEDPVDRLRCKAAKWLGN